MATVALPVVSRDRRGEATTGRPVEGIGGGSRHVRQAIEPPCRGSAGFGSDRIVVREHAARTARIFGVMVRARCSIAAGTCRAAVRARARRGYYYQPRRRRRKS
jgi:hypothetical protein